jgi:hypothetical protein
VLLSFPGFGFGFGFAVLWPRTQDSARLVVVESDSQ